ncbi:uncharacterized protein METZ01_LOCUS492439, partial [marine metagenome]
LYASTSASIVSPSLSLGNDEVTFNGTDDGSFVAIKASAAAGELRLYEGTTHTASNNFVAIQAGNVAGSNNTNHTFTWPTTLGEEGQILRTDGNNPAVLSWVTDERTSGSTTNSNVFGAGGPDGENVVMTFDSWEESGSFSWMEEEDYFKFDDPILMAGAKEFYLRETGNYIKSPSSGKLEIASSLDNDLTSMYLRSDGGMTFNVATDDAAEANDYYSFKTRAAEVFKISSVGAVDVY